MTHPQPAANGLIVTTDHSHGELKLVGLPFGHDGERTEPRRPPPLLGELTDEVLTEFGYGYEDIHRLRENGVI